MDHIFSCTVQTSEKKIVQGEPWGKKIKQLLSANQVLCLALKHVTLPCPSQKIMVRSLVVSFDTQLVLLQEMIDEADRDGDGEINEAEFLRIMKKTSLY